LEDKYQTVVFLYLQLSRTYKWTPNEIDEIEIEMLFDYLIVAELAESEPQVHIDDVI